MGWMIHIFKSHFEERQSYFRKFSIMAGCGLGFLLAVVLLWSTSTRTSGFSTGTETVNSLRLGNSEGQKELSEVSNFRQYLRIRSDHPNPNYAHCIDWLRKQALDIGLEFNHVKFSKPDLFAIWLTWKGSDPTLKSILLNSHMDVVSTNLTKWVHNTFEAIKDVGGNIYGRGAQDMKSITVQYLEAVRRLKTQGFIPLRSVHISVLPDEELGGSHGMLPFVNSEEFKRLNIGFDLDEGSASESDVMNVHYGQRAAWQVKFTAYGESGHGSTLAGGTAGEKIQIVIDRLMKLRKEQKILLESTQNFGPADVTSVNLMRLGGGIADNVLPDSLWAVFDIRIRIRPDWNFTDVENVLVDACNRAGPDVSYEFYQKSLDSAETPMDNTNVWNWNYRKSFLTATSDARYVRNAGIAAFGFNPNILVKGRVHQDNEFLNEQTFLAGIERYAVIIRNLTRIPANQSDYS